MICLFRERGVMGSRMAGEFVLIQREFRGSANGRMGRK